ncbi:MAG: hypothetical protein JST86_17905 [Bacteroidetes bacterium]|nr:hypothetical protein [Bacteroidota bacterium]
MNKFLLLMMIFCCIKTAVHAQYTKKAPPPHPLADSVVHTMCSCMMDRDDSISNINAFYDAINQCLAQNATPVMDRLLKEDGFVQQDDRASRAEAVRAIGRKLGQRLVYECDGFKKLRDALVQQETTKKELH